MKEYHPTNAHYFKTDISDIDALSASANAALQVIPKGSLAGGVHCAAIAPSRTWSHKLVDSAKVRIPNILYPGAGPFNIELGLRQGA